MVFGLAAIEVANILSGLVVLLGGIGLALRGGRTPDHGVLALFLGGTGAAWTLHFAAEAALHRGDLAGSGAVYIAVRLSFALSLSVASYALILHARSRPTRLAANERSSWWIASAIGLAAAVAIFVGRGPIGPLDAATAANLAARAARDASLGAAVAALVLFALRWRRPESARDRGVYERLSAALLLYPAIVAGIYLHPDSDRLMLGLGAALVGVAGLWIWNTMRARPSRLALALSLLPLALMLASMGTVRWQGGIDSAADGWLRVLARAATPLLYAFVALRGPDSGG